MNRRTRRLLGGGSRPVFLLRKNGASVLRCALVVFVCAALLSCSVFGRGVLACFAVVSVFPCTTTVAPATSGGMFFSVRSISILVFLLLDGFTNYYYATLLLGRGQSVPELKQLVGVHVASWRVI